MHWDLSHIISELGGGSTECTGGSESPDWGKEGALNALNAQEDLSHLSNSFEGGGAKLILELEGGFRF